MSISNNVSEKRPKTINLPSVPKDQTIEIEPESINKIIKLHSIHNINNGSEIVFSSFCSDQDIQLGLLLDKNQRHYIPLKKGFLGIQVKRFLSLTVIKLPLPLTSVMALLVFENERIIAAPITISNGLKGHIEKCEQGVLSGWVIDETLPEVPVDIAIYINDVWVGKGSASNYREDLIQAGLGNGKHGFEINIETPPYSQTNNQESLSVKIVHLTTKQIISTNDFRIDPNSTFNKKPSDKNTDSAQIQGYIDKLDQFILYGWAVSNTSNQAPSDLKIKVNDAFIDCSIIWYQREDVASQLGLQTDQVGFEVHLPGYIWESIHAGQDLQIVVYADKHRINETAVSLSRLTAAQWIEAIAQQLNRSEKVNQQLQFLSLSALEHLRYADLLNYLSPDAIDVMQKFASTMNLKDFLPSTRSENASIKFIESYAQLALWDALRRVNERLDDGMSADEMFAVVVSVINDLCLIDDVKFKYLDAVIPLLCRSGNYLHLREIANLEHWNDFERFEDVSSLTLALPALVCSKKIEIATNVLWKLTKNIDVGWLNTECIYFSVKELNTMLIQGDVTVEQQEGFAYGVLGVIDSFKGKWFSRLHDQEMINAAISLLDAYSSYTDHFRSDLIKALIRNYGLVPDFWLLLNERHSDFSNNELDRAYQFWQQIKNTLENDQTMQDKLTELVLPFHYFHALGNLETVIYLREVLMNSLSCNRSNRTDDEVLLISLLFEDEREGVRFAAYPAVMSDNLSHQFIESSSQLPVTLRNLTWHKRSFSWQTQQEVGRVIQQIQSETNKNRKKQKIQGLWGAVRAINNLNSQFLSADITGWLAILTNQIDQQNIADLQKLRTILLKMIDEMAVNSNIPAPVLSSIARLQKHNSDHVAFKALLHEIKLKLQDKIEDKYHDLFSLPSASVAVQSELDTYFGDTLVVVYSCRKYLDTRIEAVRKTWIKDLKKFKVPYLILVGDGDDTINGDVLALDVSDKYEDLPKKTLKLLEWALNHTDYQYLYKIDDDCILNLSQFFGSLTYRKHHYYGRVIERKIGSMDRTWHQSKSHTQHAQKTVDKSPEPAIYADGGGGYCLSRLAMAAVQKAASSAEGQRLIAVSLMEDKLVGDLLATKNIKPTNEDYYSYQRRRTFAEAMPVGMWENLFFPSKLTPTMMTHLDTDQDMGWVYKQQSQSELWPKKLWPTHDPVSKENQLEFLGDLNHLQELLQKQFCVVSVVRNEMVMLPHFLKHYRDLGITCFFLVDNLSDDGSREYLLKQPDVALFSADTDYNQSHFGVTWQHTVLGNYCLNKWVLLADADELLVYENFEQKSLPQFIAEREQNEEFSVGIDMIDMYPYDELEHADFTKLAPFNAAGWYDASALKQWKLSRGWFSNSKNWTSNLRHRMTPNAEPHQFVSQKYALFKYQPWVRLAEGIHYATGNPVSKVKAYFAHFKYHADFKNKVKTEIEREQHFNSAEEYKRYEMMLSESDGKFGDKKLSTQFKDSISFIKSLDKTKV